MFNEVVGGVPMSLAYCTSCGSGISFETGIAGRPNPFVLQSICIRLVELLVPIE